MDQIGLHRMAPGRRKVFFASAGLCSVLLVAVSLAGCGSSSGGGPTRVTWADFQAAIVAIGQPDLVSSQVNQGGAVGPNTINSPYGNAFVTSSGALAIGDYSNNRELGFITVPTTSGASADLVLGQPDFTSSTEGAAAEQMGGPQTPVVSSDGKLVVDEYDNSRVLIWNTIPTMNATPADVVVGQAAFGQNGTACSATGMHEPESLTVTPDGKLIVADSNNNRVLIYDQIPTSNGATPDLILGQDNATTCAANNDGTGASGTASASNFNYPSGVWSDGTRLVVVDSDNNRVLIWNTFPTSSFQPADVVLGQPDFTSDVINNDGMGNGGATPSAQSLDDPYIGVYSNGTQLFVADGANNRVLIWNSFPTKNFQAADVVIGQPTFTCDAIDSDPSGNCSAGTTNAQGLHFPAGVFVSGKKLIVTDNENNRYLIYQGK